MFNGLLSPDVDVWAPAVSISQQQYQYEFQGAARYHRIATSDRASLWYLVRDDASQSAYFVLYREPSNRVHGYCGKSGFQQDVPLPANRFALDGFEIQHASRADGLRSLFVQSQQKLYEVDLTGRQIRPVLATENVYTSSVVRPSYDRMGRNVDEEDVEIVVATDQRLVFFDADDELVQSYQLPDRFRNRDFTVYRLTDGTAVGRTYNADVDSSTVTLTWFDTQGTTLRTEEWTTPSTFSSALGTGWVLACVAPAPVVDVGFGTLVLPTLATRGLEDHVDKASIVKSMRAGMLPPFLATLLLSAALAWHADRRMRRYGLSRSYAWMAFILLLGLPGYLGWRFHRRWPARIPCPSCNNQTPCNQPACTSCGTDFPPPQLTGTEVFA